ncbi:MAG: indole-3-glycerol phosphate synthase TrpC [Nitrospirae bacterium]|nr:indole-3-glycerol phosphate synthase TrpC [Nitrospirota bacterium]
MENLLIQIVENKKNELKEDKLTLPLKELRSRLGDIEPPRNFRAAISEPKGQSLNLIAEIKKRSPLKGTLIEELKVTTLSKKYEEGGAAAISVITEKKFFEGSPEYINMAKGASKLPVLRKDFLIDEYHIYEARYLGADALLFIAAILEPSVLSDFIALTSELGMSSLVEVHSEKELEKALKADARNLMIIGINNRNLRTFKVDINTTFRIMNEIPDGRIIVSESGIYSRDDVKMLADAGVNAVLVGEAIITSGNVVKKIKELIG